MALADLFECTIDFEGQRLAENLTYYVLIVASLVGFITGYALESLQLTLSIFGIGFATACVVRIRQWAMNDTNASVFLLDSSSSHPGQCTVVTLCHGSRLPLWLQMKRRPPRRRRHRLPIYPPNQTTPTRTAGRLES
ncbi:hypothetical protein [Absidia glauca]|uniref:Signal peptidase complex subunit 1 n=1 Tax=Absidia glauca TaxID=4829 RepID=A0A163JIW1_ABSGL|nr:hypothetical protein [Absidia glauca]